MNLARIVVSFLLFLFTILSEKKKLMLKQTNKKGGEKNKRVKKQILKVTYAITLAI